MLFVIRPYCSVKATPDSPPVHLNPLCLALPFCQPFVITRHSSWLFTFADYSCKDHCGTEVPFGQHKCSFYKLCLANSVFRLHVFSVTLRDRDGRDVLLLQFNRGRVRLKVVIGLQCL